ncbi:hypothetical protein FNF28_00306 [Cafeteria roenbergensis]|uniref:Condensin complex subunit 2 n=1 Tax=Cafeteria roenbergensis TaxID=33653 RepID=A0A5A8E3D5_CAFRO|nr:hypothetical protein FNF28_00306 [Cafeteria roenbergensis]
MWLTLCPFLGSLVGSVVPASARKARRKSLPASHPAHGADDGAEESARGGLKRPATARRPKRRRESVRFGDDRNETREVTRWISKLSPSDFAKAHMGAGDEAEDDAAAAAGWDAADDNGPDLADDDLLDDTTPAKRPRLSEGSNSSDIVPRRLNPSSSSGSQVPEADGDDVSDAGSERGSPAASDSLLRQSAESLPASSGGADRFLRRSARRDIQRDILATLIGATGAGADAGAGKVTAEFGFSAPSAGEPAGFGDGVEDDDADFAFAPAAGLA